MDSAVATLAGPEDHLTGAAPITPAAMVAATPAVVPTRHRPTLVRATRLAANMVNPIRPSEVIKHKATVVPDAVIEAFNHLIAVHFSGGQARVTQDAVVELLTATGMNREEIFDKKYLDVEDIYAAAGWKVEYDKPGFNESYAANFTFTAPPRGGSGVPR